ncbi:hypothetical protein B0I31_1266 [Saccharothrix carnea]|uniref:Class 3 adenylate cyclase n=1 Tax=Saccharothrix carnea TaxID=1280637 RepID=A0A2P8HID8_SACCR|nr:hypothetical protein [Saccharothrix carnea]PSL45975.1 hypothetical protein B0I31_1266 [Saccharothrix carnea]
MTAPERREVAAHRWSAGGTRARPVTTAAVGRPALGVDGDGRVLMTVPVELGDLPTGWRHTAVFLRVGLEDNGIRPVDLWCDAGVPVAVSGLGDRTFGWFLGGFTDRPLDLRRFTATAALDVPGGVAALAVQVRLDASVTGRPVPVLPLRKIRHVRVERPWEFTAPLPADRPVPVARPSTAVPADTPTTRLCLAADVENYRRFRNPEAARAQERFRELLTRARELAGVDESAVRVENAGDGQFAVLPAGLDETAVIPGLVAGLRTALRYANADLNDHARLRIRVALHRGTIGAVPSGWVGTAAIAVHRMLDSAPLRQALATAPRADLAVIVPDSLYRDVIAHGYGDLTPESFHPTTVELPDKGFTEPAWIHVP